MHIKICGATHPSDVDLLAGLGIDLIGLWHGVPHGHADLSMDQLSGLAETARVSAAAHPVLVTLLDDIDTIRRAVLESGVGWVQLHGYQHPALVRAVKAAGPPGLTVVKVLHVQDGGCVERTLIKSYERAGVDFFLLDAMSEDGRIGSTAQRLNCSVAADLVGRMSRPFFLAGGISAENRCDYEELTRHPRFFGIDVDTNARGANGEFHPHRIEAIQQRWHTGAEQEMVA
ncbi:MAG: phosphoribosylanthranilate isomerase [Pseudonocardiaceae bacterium]